MNQEEFKKFVEQHQHSLVATLFKLTGNWETARDIAQESFLRFWNRRSKLKKDKNPAFLLFRIGVNCCIDFLRSKKEKISGIEPSDDIFLQDEEAAGLYKDELFKIIHNCCKNLSEKQRFCFILRDLEGFLVEEITELLDISAESVRGNLHYARKKIRKILEEKHPIFFEDIL